MNYKIIFFIFFVLILNTQITSAAENDYGIVKAWFNEKNATVEGITLKIGEPGEVKIEVSSKINGSIFVELSEPGGTKSYQVISGPSRFDEFIDQYDVKSGWSKEYKWIISPNGAWKNGNAPINIFVQFSKIEKGKLKGDKEIQFSIANPYILDEQYPGSSPAKTTGAAQPSPTGTSSEQQQAPFLGAIGALAVMLGVWMWKHGKKLGRL